MLPDETLQEPLDDNQEEESEDERAGGPYPENNMTRVEQLLYDHAKSITNFLA